MRGRILGFDTAAGTGAIAGDDGRRYSFAAAEWRDGTVVPGIGLAVDFDSADQVAATSIYPLPAAGIAPGQPYAKSNVAAGLLALFLGGWGIHKFYLGYTNEGVILLAGSVISFILCIVVIGFFGLMAIGTVCLIEAIIYLTKSEAEFDQIYVQNKRPWF